LTTVELQMEIRSRFVRSRFFVVMDLLQLDRVVGDRRGHVSPGLEAVDPAKRSPPAASSSSDPDTVALIAFVG
jgi:hypothetical protein